MKITNMNYKSNHSILSLFSILWLVVLLLNQDAQAVESVCAQVKIEIRQEVSLERQAFDAVMKINNGLETASLNNIDITVQFTDDQGNPVIASSDPNNTEASFFIKVSSMNGITDINGNGEILPSTSAEIHWLIIPAPGSGGNIPSGKAYNVGATLKYQLGDDAQEVTVIPDVIYVKPLPQITLDYFLTRHVVADDPFTAVIEPSEPFTLGVRITNHGQATAKQFKIDSAQPRIIENEQGLLINFSLVGSTVDDQPIEPDLLLDFGDIPGNSSRIGRWWMQTTLAGQFVDFTATWSHSDELGGQLTSIMEAVNTHFLVHDVQVDLPGRDGVKDFLALDGEQLRVYESDSLDTIVSDQSALSTLTLSHQVNDQDYYDLLMPVDSGFNHARIAITKAQALDKVIAQVVRSDNKVLKPANAWISKEGNGADGWQYYFNIFDYNTPGAYKVIFGDKVITNQAPIIDFIPQQSAKTGQAFSLTISASDPDNTIPILKANGLPAGASFTDQGNGTAVLEWTPTQTQAGEYSVTYQASDGALTSQRSSNITVTLVDINDQDGDGLDDAWELLHFGSLDRDGAGDYDNDGKTDLEEFNDNTDPAEFYITGLPQIHSPTVGSEISQLNTSLIINNAEHLADMQISYQFQLYEDETLTLLVEQSGLILETTNQTTWTPVQTLKDNHWYTWRVRVYNGENYSQWVTGYFFVNTVNDAPSTPIILTPPNGSQVSSTTPALEVSPAHDIDGDTLKYSFTLYSDIDRSVEVDRIDNLSPGDTSLVKWFITTPLSNGLQYFWEAQVSDGEGGIAKTELVNFTVNTGNQAPGTPLLLLPELASALTSQDVELIINNSIDPENDPLEYYFELDTREDFTSSGKQSAMIPAGVEQTSWTLNGLNDNTYYYWRVRAYDGASYSSWLKGEFNINLQNDAPTTPVIANPGDQSWVTTLLPILQIEPAIDIDGDTIKYEFQLSTEITFSNGSYLSFEHTDTNLTLTEALLDNTQYYWRVRAIDQYGLASTWSPISAFFVNYNGKDDVPVITLLEPSATIEIDNSLTIRWDDQDPDSNARIALYYNTQPNLDGATLIVDGLHENDESSQDSYLWDTSLLEDGTYSIIAQIQDKTSTTMSVAGGQVIKKNAIPVVQVTSDVTGIIQQGEKVIISVAVDDPTYHYDYRYLLKEQDNDNWQLLQDWSEQANYQWDSNGYSGLITIEAQVRRSGSTGPIGNSDIALEVEVPLDCKALTTATLDAVSNHLSIPYALLHNKWYHTEFTYLGEVDGKIWKLQNAEEVTNPLPDDCQSTFVPDGKNVILTDIHLSGTEIHYQAVMKLKAKKDGLYLYQKSENYDVKTELFTEHTGIVIQGETILFSTKVYDTDNVYEYRYRISDTLKNRYKIIQPWSDSNLLALDTTQLVGDYRIQVQARVVGSDTIIGTDEWPLTITSLWSKEQCQANTTAVLDLDNHHLTIPYVLHKGNYYRTEFLYLGEQKGVMTWQLDSATQESEALPFGCDAKFTKKGKTVTLASVQIKGTELYYRAKLKLKSKGGDVYLKLIKYKEL